MMTVSLSNHYRQFCSFSLWLLCTASEGLLLLSPPEEARICEGEQLELICTTLNASILRWTSILQNEQGMVQIYSRHIASMDMTQQASSLVVNSTYFNVSRISHQEMVPLVSRLLISPVNIGLNGTKWNCTEVYVDTTKSNDAMMASTTINIMGDSSYITNHPEVIISVDYGTYNATVFLEWTPKSHTYYNISAQPQLEVIINVTSLLSNAKLTVPYNTHYNVSIMATLCGQYTTATNIEIHYAKCEYPFQARTANDAINFVQAVGYVNPSLEGATINFSCPAGKILTGPKTSMAMCMSNGKWESVATIENNFICKVDFGPPLLPSNGYIILSNDTTEGSSISFVCLTSHSETATVYTAVCSQDGSWEPQPVADTCQLGIVSKDKPIMLEVTLTVLIISSISVPILTSIVFFLFGYACGWRQGCKASRSVSGGQTISETNTVPLYERVVPNITTEQVDLKLTKNEAYASLNIGLSQS